MPEHMRGPAMYFPSIERKYGKSIQEWKAIIRSSRLTTWADMTALLTWEYGMGQGHANALVLHTLREG
jgi:hypothetical protein